MAAWLDNVRFNPTLGGTTDWTYSSAVAAYQSPAAAGAVNGRNYKYFAIDGSNNWELGEGAWNSGTTVLSRTTIVANSLGTTAKISFAAAPQVAIVAIKEDMISIEEANSFTAAQKAQIQANIKVSGPTIQRFTSGTAATYTTPANCTWIRIRMVGGGSGGGGAGTGAGSSSAATASTWSGGSLSAGGGAVSNNSVSPISGGAATGGNVANIPGSQGSAANNVANTESPAGGASVFGGAGGGSLLATAGGSAATNSGSGGAGGATTIVNAGASSGGAGGYVEHIITSPAATYTYTVGAGSAGGSAGTSGGAGGAGAAGLIIVEEYYN